jgi:hypothetical protein
MSLDLLARSEEGSVGWGLPELQPDGGAGMMSLHRREAGEEGKRSLAGWHCAPKRVGLNPSQCVGDAIRGWTALDIADV